MVTLPAGSNRLCLLCHHRRSLRAGAWLWAGTTDCSVSVSTGSVSLFQLTLQIVSLLLPQLTCPCSVLLISTGTSSHHLFLFVGL